jgi:hypothetical protein
VFASSSARCTRSTIWNLDLTEGPRDTNVMDYDAFKATFLRALAAARIPTIGGDRLNETFDPRSLDRTCGTYVEGPDRGAAGIFHVSGELSWRWRAIHTARAATTEEDLLSDLLGRNDVDEVTTKPPWVRIDVKLHATIQLSQTLAMPSTTRWARWGHDVAEQFDNKMRLIPAEDSRMSADGRLEVLGWQGEPQLTVECTAAGELKLRAIELPAFQILELPRRWDDPDREPDGDPEVVLDAMFKRLDRGLAAWGKLVRQLAG